MIKRDASGSADVSTRLAALECLFTSGWQRRWSYRRGPPILLDTEEDLYAAQTDIKMNIEPYASHYLVKIFRFIFLIYSIPSF